MLSKLSSKNPSETYILIDEGFDELEVIQFLHRFRQEGLHIKTVCLFNKLVFSHHGVGIKADLSLDETPSDPSPESLLILPTGGHNGDNLRRDARVRTLLQAFNNNHAKVAVTGNNESLIDDLYRSGTTQAQRPNSGQELSEFVDILASRVAFAW
ncbi:MAG: DJ-1/PfpI family protein [Candidatus Promineifilaceae bacterium]